MITSLCWVPCDTLEGHPKRFNSGTAEEIAKGAEASGQVGITEPGKDKHGNPTTYIDETQLSVAIEEMDLEEDMILPSDTALLVGAADEQMSHVDVVLVEPEQDNQYVHHYYDMVSFPNAIEYLDTVANVQKGNFCAVATMEPGVELWNLDVMDAPSPFATLGGPERPNDPDLLKDDSHTEAVIGLSWNKLQRNVLASASADTNIKLWDLMTATCVKTFTHHQQEVSDVEWHLSDSSVMATGSYDKTLAVWDVRADKPGQIYNVNADVEVVHWLFGKPNILLCGTDTGYICIYDVRTAVKPLNTFKAHPGDLTDVALHPHIPTIIATGSRSMDDKAPMKVFDLDDLSKPALVFKRSEKLGPVLSLSFCPDLFGILACGTVVMGENWPQPRVVDLFSHNSVKSRFGKYEGGEDWQEQAVKEQQEKEAMENATTDKKPPAAGDEGDNDDDDTAMDEN